MIQRFSEELMHMNWWCYGISIAIMVIVLFSIIISQQKKWKQRLRNVQEQTERAIGEARSQAESEVKAIQDHALKMINEEKQRSKEAIQTERERIDAERDTLEALGEKELMVRTVMALGGYGARLDRIEAQICNIFKNAGAQMQSALSSISSSINENLRAEVNNLIGEVNSLEEHIRITGQSTYDNDDLMGKLDDVLQEIRNASCDVSSVRSDVDSVKSTIDSIQSDVSSLEWKISST